eukprot:COSAG06_NODE_13885_length_1209_cov_1.292793_1_plen_142_part_00
MAAAEAEADAEAEAEAGAQQPSLRRLLPTSSANNNDDELSEDWHHQLLATLAEMSEAAIEAAIDANQLNQEAQLLRCAFLIEHPPTPATADAGPEAVASMMESCRRVAMDVLEAEGGGEDEVALMARQWLQLYEHQQQQLQ